VVKFAVPNQTNSHQTSGVISLGRTRTTHTCTRVGLGPGARGVDRVNNHPLLGLNIRSDARSYSRSRLVSVALA
jgi:hypothetical protein